MSLAEKGITIGIFSFNKASYEWYTHPNITIFFEPESKINAESTLTKLAYLKYVSILKRIIRHFKPDVLHAHYATSYGLVGALSGFHPFIISSWGTDVMKFPSKNFVAKSILKYNYKQADFLCATSNVIKDYISKIVNKPVSVIPFGIDVKQFAPKKVDSLFHEGEFVIGCIKSLEPLYKIDVLLKAFALLSTKHKNARLLIIGVGSQMTALKNLSTQLGIQDKVVFTGRIPFNDVANYYNMLNLLVNISEYESFGVSVIEAMACEKPVVVTNVGGLNEIIQDDSFGLKVSVDNVEETRAAIEKLMLDKDLSNKIALRAREHVVKYYNWEDNIASMIALYKESIEKQKK